MFHNVIYEIIKRKDPTVAIQFSGDYSLFVKRRQMMLDKGHFESIRAYFFDIFSIDPERYRRELRCITGNVMTHLWLQDFENVVCEAYTTNYQDLAVTSRNRSETLISELGGLLGDSE